MKPKTIILLLTLGIGIFIYYYFFIETLSVSQLIGKTSNPQASIFINLFDFDTGLTRYDIYHINCKNNYWNSRIREINSMADPVAKEKANEELLAEIIQDPSVKKITKKFLGFLGKSANSATSLLSGLEILK